MTYGKHIMFDMELQPGIKFPKSAAEAMIVEILTTIGLKAIGPVHYDLYSGDQDWDGPSFTVHIQTSHITAHYFEKGYMFLDVFSCSEYAQTEVANVIGRHVKLKSLTWHEAKRGKLFPWGKVQLETK